MNQHIFPPRYVYGKEMYQYEEKLKELGSTMYFIEKLAALKL
jgi:hypothetical protein